MLHVDGQLLRVGRQAGRHAGRAGGLPLLLFNGIGGNIELLGPIAGWMPEREVITFDIPGVGHSPLPSRPYRMKGVARLAAGVLDHYGHEQADVLGVSWGGAAAQQFARSQAARCRRLILCATATGMFMIPARPSVLLKMATPRRYISKSYARSISGDIYGGDYRRDPDLAGRHFKHIKWQSRLGYYLQIAAGTGWTSVHWLHRLQQPTLVMAGSDDPLIPFANARLLHKLIPNSELEVFDCGHLFLMTRPQQCARSINEFLDRP
ncbi:MAG: poly(3-hydroxyalkanoate) depolymerase [Burkholderiales bacterium]|nr:poly(3-hydroxyalkanoate) depolymerase [Burkholderiales bacterium]MDE2398518.1 poly(3-hydroxyalkanoate) depolymerase [Burkholderiales bacterium]MDE2454070.1 poly(3-hydroxyalkanoate) depolymerase [Burkholderiales bacterium]